MTETATAPDTRPADEENSDPTLDRFFWYELMTTDQDAAIHFYQAVVGWTAADQQMTDSSGSRYMILSAGDRAIGGVMQLDQAMLDGGARPGWLGYIHVADTDAAAKRVAANGGSIHMPPQDIPNVGRFAMVADPGGAPFYIMTPQTQDEAPPPTAAPTTPGFVSWRELYAGDGEAAAFAFYSGLFGWETMTEMPMGELGTYRIFGADGEQMGGMMDRPKDMPVSAWTFYFNVDAIDAAAERIKAHGGQVLIEPHEVPGGSWIVQGLDPQGASFALVAERR